METVDLRKERKELYAPSATGFTEVVVPAFSFLMIDGRGDPSADEGYRKAVEALYAVSYAVKFASKQLIARDWVVLPLEGLWWSDRPEEFAATARSEWNWTMMIRQPDWVTGEILAVAFEKAAKKKVAALAELRREVFEEGRCVQILHIGPYAEEAPTIARLHNEYLPEHGLVENGQHHEIYLGDPRRSAPEKLRTILRQPVAEA